MTPLQKHNYQMVALQVHNGNYQKEAELKRLQKLYNIDITPNDMSGWFVEQEAKRRTWRENNVVKNISTNS